MGMNEPYPKLKIDHLAVSGASRDAAKAHIEDALGLPLQIGGDHPDFGTHNHLMGLEDGLYLEAISINPAAVAPNRPRWFDLDNFEGPPRLTNWICAVPNLETVLLRWPDAGGAVSLRRGDLRWQMAVPASGALPFDGLFPPLIAWQGTLHPCALLNQSRARLEALTVRGPQAEALSALLGPIEGSVVRFETATAPELIAEFQTPHGRRVLT